MQDPLVDIMHQDYEKERAQYRSLRNSRRTPDCLRLTASHNNQLFAFLQKALDPPVHFAAYAQIFQLVQDDIMVAFVKGLALIEVYGVDRSVVLEEQDKRLVIFN